MFKKRWKVYYSLVCDFGVYDWIRMVYNVGYLKYEILLLVDFRLLFIYICLVVEGIIIK